MLAGDPPQLNEVGPFTIRRTTANYNIRFDDARRRMDWQWLVFDELVPEKSCDVCTSDALVSALPLLLRDHSHARRHGAQHTRSVGRTWRLRSGRPRRGRGRRNILRAQRRPDTS